MYNNPPARWPDRIRKNWGLPIPLPRHTLSGLAACQRMELDLQHAQYNAAYWEYYGLELQLALYDLMFAVEDNSPDRFRFADHARGVLAYVKENTTSGESRAPDDPPPALPAAWNPTRRPTCWQDRIRRTCGVSLPPPRQTPAEIAACHRLALNLHHTQRIAGYWEHYGLQLQQMLHDLQVATTEHSPDRRQFAADSRNLLHDLNENTDTWSPIDLRLP